jgi:hypothetical protein
MIELKRYLKRYYLEYEKITRSSSFPISVPPNEQITSESTNSGTSSVGSVCAKRRVEYAFAQLPLKTRTLIRKKTELDTYLNDPRVPLRLGENLNVIEW